MELSTDNSGPIQALPDRARRLELEDKNHFSQARPAHYGIAWPNGQDFSADTLIWDIQHAKEETA